MFEAFIGMLIAYGLIVAGAQLAELFNHKKPSH